VYMKRRALFAAAAFALLSVASADALAQDAPPAVAPAPPAQAAPAAPAAPADVLEPALAFADTLFDDGNYLGVRVEELTRENAKGYGLSGEPRGVVVIQVLKGSPAERAGLRERDVIVRFDGEPVTSVRKLNRLVAESSPEHTARIGVLRGGSEQEVSATLARRDRLAPAAAASFGPDWAGAQRFGKEWAKNAEAWKLRGGEPGSGLEGFRGDGPGAFVLGRSRRIGVTTSALGRQLADYFGVSHGVLISSVESGSPADKAGLKAGDVVTEADGRTIDDASDLVRALGAKDEGEVTLTVVRGKKQRTVRVRPERRKTPQSLFTTPDAVRVAPPVASLAPRVLAAPRALVAPGVAGAPYTLADPDFITPPLVIAAPHLPVTPRVRVAPRVRVVVPEGQIL
jgi:membrane-associated protease RseP (regulator of RpoE activity)